MAEEFIFDSDHIVTFCSDFDNSPADEFTDSFLESNLQDLNDRWNSLQRSYRSLCTKTDEIMDKKFLEAARGKYSTCTREYHKCKSRILELQKAMNADAPTQDCPSSRNEEFYTMISVPPCDTDIFYGGYEEWPSFRDMFTAVYIENPRIPPVQKLYHLRLKVQGQAGSLIRKYKLCADNFTLAWDALKDRYENKRILVENQIKILLNLPPVLSESSESLQNMQTTVNDCLSAISSHDVSIDSWDPFIIMLCCSKLPVETLSLWEQSLESHRNLVKWEKMDKFLSHRCEVVERLESRKKDLQIGSVKKDTGIKFFKAESSQYPCKICGSNHSLKNCPQFLSFDPQARNKFVSNNRVCLNCLAYTHIRKDCPSRFSCSHCQKNHHSLLHFSKPVNARANTNSPDNNPETSTKARGKINQSANVHTAQTGSTTHTENTLLPTAIVKIYHQGESFKARAFLDQGSEKSFISKKLQQQLMLPTETRHFQIHGIGGEVTATSNASCKLVFFSEKYDRFVHTEAIVVPKITRMLPSLSFSKSIPLDEFKDIDLADPNFYLPNQVDLLIGSNALPQILLEGVRSIAHTLMGQWTIFGWVISGPVNFESCSTFSIQVKENSQDPLSEQLKRFWEQEEVSIQQPISKEEEYCESLYKKTVCRNSEGRYVVKLPFKEEFPQSSHLGVSRSAALAQFRNLEQSLEKKRELAEIYHNVLLEYSTLNHMEPTTASENITQNGCSSFYLPHHAVFKPTSSSTKVRVVFNASKKTSSGLSLNDVLHVGPTLQSDLMTLILNWRFYKYVFNGDIEKMYRQIRVNDEDIQFQRILFRQNSNSPVKDYALNTVTFGVNCAPYLAIRTLVQLAHDNEHHSPQAAHILLKETYVDDILSGAHNIPSAVNALAQVKSVLKSAGFPLKKITSNSSDVLSSVPKDDILNSDFLKFAETSVTKTLGIQWNAISDCFSYTIDPISPVNAITKRQILSHVAKLFDPAGWISPIVINAKIILQQLWLEGTNWDENVKPAALENWNCFVQNLSIISTLRIPRWINYTPELLTQIHGFCDASERAYCAAIYFRIGTENLVSTHLFASKTRVAPINPVSLPRLELCGAVLLSKLIQQVTNSLNFRNYEIFLWTDSTIVLSWLEKPPSTWKTYVANRTSQIIRNIGNASWRHVRSYENPADLGSRGCDSNQLLHSSLWWTGPAWLQKSPEEWPKPIILTENTMEKKRKIESFCLFMNEELLSRFSKWDRAIRVMSYVTRFLRKINLRLRNRSSRLPLSPSLKLENLQPIDSQEFAEVKHVLISMAQRRYYPKEYESLTQNKSIGRKSSLLPLNPYLDKNGVIRVNGRISESTIPFKERHPIILPAKSAYARLYLDYVHNLLMHADINLMLRVIRGECFIPRLRSAVRFVIRNCVICVRYKQKIKSQLMGALPTERSSFSLPFTFTGLDFAGPFSIKTSLVRNAPYHKGYVCVFVCFCTKALHLELCSDLTTGAFRAAFSRFIGRRGLPKKVMSDNGTNFVGAERAIRAEYDEFVKKVAKDIAERYALHGFQWSFIPPNAPHMGGLWEAGVKSFKTHFKKVAQGSKFTFEEFSTLLVRIESVLNSRPLSPMSDDHNELLALTPGHFLRGAPLLAMPEAHNESLTFHNRWERLKSLHHRFAQRWKDEYLKELQKRYKWQHQEENIKIGQLVIIKDDTLPPNEWKLARINRIFLGNDGNVRVADLKTQTGNVTRALSKLCVLPISPVELETNQIS